MKIAFDHQTFNSQSYGGISRYYTILAEGLLKQGQELSIFAGIHVNNYLSALPSDVVSGVKLKKYPPKTGRLFQAFNHYVANSQINHWQPDIIHETYYSSLPPPKASTPRVTTVYDMIHELYPKMFSTRDHTSKWKRNALNRVEHIISISHSTKKDLVELFGIDESKISVVHLGVDSSFSQYSPEQDSKIKRSFLLYVGGRGTYKNFNNALHAIANSERLKSDFDLIAFGGGRFNNDEFSLIESLGFRDGQIQQIGGSDCVLMALYHQASAFIYPSIYEGFGLPPLEAMASSCPVISSNSSSMPEVIGDAGEYFDPTEMDEMTVAIENVVYSGTRIEELKSLGLNRTKLFSWDECATETLDVYNKILG
jgi:glycosyltransferase involved in cell wall biosynthesis